MTVRLFSQWRLLQCSSISSGAIIISPTAKPFESGTKYYMHHPTGTIEVTWIILSCPPGQGFNSILGHNMRLGGVAMRHLKPTRSQRCQSFSLFSPQQVVVEQIQDAAAQCDNIWLSSSSEDEHTTDSILDPAPEFSGPDAYNIEA